MNLRRLIRWPHFLNKVTRFRIEGHLYEGKQSGEYRSETTRLKFRNDPHHGWYCLIEYDAAWRFEATGWTPQQAFENLHVKVNEYCERVLANFKRPTDDPRD